MSRRVDGTGFGWLEIDGQRYEHDVPIRLGGKIKRRKKSSPNESTVRHTRSRSTRHIFEEGAAMLIIGSGQYGNVLLSPEAEEYLREQHCKVRLLPTPEAIVAWNDAPRTAICLFHVTC